ncbi:GNAT family N-acetyltransferase [Haloparvum alkalitolerans]|uniref:GNAT family N-acetyltransferase n=1 Tax=Haloparvum alkalitolerans TaxID=1042953 RepID=UPI003CEC9B81
MTGPIFLRGDRVDLHVATADDRAFLARGHNHPAVRRWMSSVRPNAPATPEGDVVAERYLGDDRDADLVVRADGERVGFASLLDVAPDAGRAEVAAWFPPERQGQGYGTEAVELLLAYAFEERRLHRVYAGARADNEPSRRIVETAGFTEEGRQRDHYYVDGEHVDRVFYGLLREEWEGGE